VLLIAAGVFILFEAVDHIQNPHAIAHEGLAMVTIFVSMVVSYWAFRHNHAAARDTESSALHVNALHFLSDVVASAGVLVGLILMKLTGWFLIDPIIAICVAVYIFSISIKQVKKALLELADTGLPAHELKDIKNVLDRHREQAIEMHELRTRKSGSERHVDFHMVVCGHRSVHESHALCDRIESEIQEVYPRTSVHIHVEPCEHEGVDCVENCPFRDEQGRMAPSRPLAKPQSR
jgi:cation diffusion facilitator family transporter